MKFWTLYIVDEKNRYTDSFCENISDTFLPNSIYYKSWKGLNTDRLNKFIALTTVDDILLWRGTKARFEIVLVDVQCFFNTENFFETYHTKKDYKLLYLPFSVFKKVII